MISEGSAFLDPSGRVVVADVGFRSLLGLPAGDATAALRARGAADPGLATLLAGEGPDAVVLAASPTTPPCEVVRTRCADGVLVLARVAGRVTLPAPPLELAIQAIALARLAGSVAHEVKNPLNAMALQLALLGDKIGTASDALASSCAGNLGSLKNQIGRINELVRRYVEVADPSPASGFDASALLCDVTQLFGHEARRRRVAIACDASPDGVRAAGDPVRAARLLLGLVWRALSGTPQGGRLTTRAALAGDGQVALSVEHVRGEPDPELAWVGAVAGEGARALGGRLDETIHDGTVRAMLMLPKERAL